jgi:hypothetical protein
MGQQAVGILWGAELPLDLTELEEGALDDLLEWRSGNGARTVHVWNEEGQDLIGFWIAVEQGEWGTLDLLGEPLRVDDLPKLGAYALVREAWREFAPWAKGRGVELQEPTLWIAPTEIS